MDSVGSADWSGPMTSGVSVGDTLSMISGVAVSSGVGSGFLAAGGQGEGEGQSSGQSQSGIAKLFHG